MPLYTFHCDSCNEDIELFLSARELRKGVICPTCKGTSSMTQQKDGAHSSAQGNQSSCTLVSKKS